MSGRRLEVDAARCTGCNSCVLTCVFVHEGAFSLSGARIRVDADPISAEYTPRVCVQCEGAPCIAACPVEALSRDPATNAIALDEATCTGCRSCMDACPYGGIGFDEESRRPRICDLCGGAPACVDVCRLPQAIRFVPQDS